MFSSDEFIYCFPFNISAVAAFCINPHIHRMKFAVQVAGPSGHRAVNHVAAAERHVIVVCCHSRRATTTTKILKVEIAAATPVY